LGDIPELFALDGRFGIVQVLDSFFCPEDGFSMGSPAAAGGANVLGGISEYQYLSSLPLPIQYEIKARTVLMRWMDDVLQLWSRSISKGSKRALRTLAAPNFYGGKLDQKSEGRSADTAFGFKLELHGGLVQARSARPYADERAEDEGIQAQWPHVQGGSAYTSRKVKVSSATGRIFRELDMTNATEADVIAGVKRVVGEMVCAGFERRILRTAVGKVGTSSWVRLVSVRRFLSESDPMIAEWCARYDQLERRMQKKDRLLRALEACCK
jgi:hypothetical protein